MDQEKRIKAMSKELLTVRSRMEELGPIVLGTMSRSTKKYRTKDGQEHVCADSAVLKFSGAGVGSTVRIPRESEKSVRKMIEDGKKWRALNKRWVLLTSRLAVCGALKKSCS